MDIQDTITSRLPSSLVPIEAVLEGYILKWQTFLAPLVDPEIPSTALSLDASWPLLEAELVVSLVIYEILDNAIKAYLLSAVGTGSSEGGTLGIVKKVVTGPAEAEFFSPKETMAEVVKPGGLYSTTKDAVCMLASRLKVPLYICPDNSNLVMAPTVSRRPSHHRFHH